MKKRSIILWIFAFIVIIAVFFLKRDKKTEASYTIVKKGVALQTILANGRIAGGAIVTLSFQKGGIVQKIHVTEGQVVKAGDTLLSLDCNEQMNFISRQKDAVKLARANLEKLRTVDIFQSIEQVKQAKEREELSRKQLERKTTLYNKKSITAVELDLAKNEYSLAESDLKIAQSRAHSLETSQKKILEIQLSQALTSLKEAETDLSRTVIIAPEAGKVVKIKVKRGETVSVGTDALSFFPSDTTTHVEVQIDESDIGKIAVGQRALVKIASISDSTFDALVRDIVPIIDASRGTATIQLSINKQSGSFIPDQTVSAQIITGSTPDVLMIEQRFVLLNDKDTYVYLYNKGKALQKSVSVRELGNALYQISRGINEGDTILFSVDLKNDASVKLIGDN